MAVTLTVQGQPQTKYLSFSNSPTEKGYGEFTKRITQSDFSRVLNGMHPGDKLAVKMPMGKFTLDEKDRKMAMLSGGIGITPLRSICKYIADQSLPVDVVLFYGNRNIDEIPFKDDLDSMPENIRVIYALDEVPPDLEWAGEKGMITEEMIRRRIPDYSERCFYVCGPPGMVKCLMGLLKDELAIPGERVKQENFAGY